MEPVTTIVLPDNGRMDLDPSGSEDALGSFATLPIPMPKTAMTWTGPDGRPVAMWADDLRIHPKDFAVVWHGITQYNDDLRQRGVVPEPAAAAMAATDVVVFDDDDEDAADRPIWRREVF